MPKYLGLCYDGDKTSLLQVYNEFLDEVNTICSKNLHVMHFVSSHLADGFLKI